MSDKPEIRNPFTNGKIVSVGTDPRDYFRLPGGHGSKNFTMSNSELREFAGCPRKWRMDGEEEKDTKALRWGNLVDCLALTPDQFEARYALQPATYTNSKGIESDWTLKSDTCRAWEDERKEAGIEVVSSGERDEAQKAVDLLLADSEIKRLIEKSDKQVLVTADYRHWEFDPKIGKSVETDLVIPIKGLIDLVPASDTPIFGTCLADLKTLRHAELRAWGRDVFQRGYYVQSALYLWLYNAATGENRDSFLHVLSENEPPYLPAKRVLTSEYLEMGRRFILGALAHYCDCLKNDRWPGYDHGKDGWHGWAFTAPEPWMVGLDPQYAPVMPDEPAETPKSEFPT